MKKLAKINLKAQGWRLEIINALEESLGNGLKSSPTPIAIVKEVIKLNKKFGMVVIRMSVKSLREKT